jgi:general stress protein 26
MTATTGSSLAPTPGWWTISKPKVSLGFQGKVGMLGMKPVFVSIEGTARLIQDKAQFEAHWTTDLERWFKDGIDTPGLTLIQVHGTRAHYWNGEEQGELVLDAAIA